jgi:hypothetical protein
MIVSPTLSQKLIFRTDPPPKPNLGEEIEKECDLLNSKIRINDGTFDEMMLTITIGGNASSSVIIQFIHHHGASCCSERQKTKNW